MNPDTLQPEMSDARHAPAAEGSASEKQPLLTVRGIQKQFGGVQALRGVTLSIEAGEVYHLLGENGCGKSTLIKIIAGAHRPDAGEIELAGRRHKWLDPISALVAGIETVYQDLSLMPNMTVAENIGLTEQLAASNGHLARRLDRKRLAVTATRALETVALPVGADFLATPVSELPLATRQLIAIARAVATRARLVIMDEPTTSLTKREVDNLIDVVRRLQTDGVSVLFVTHKLDECYLIGGHAIIMRDGECVSQGPIADYSKARLTELMTGRALETTRYRTVSPGDTPMLQVDALSLAGQLDDISFTLRHGEILGVTGLLDSGRNSLVLALAGIRPATAGTIRLQGAPVRLATPADAIARGIGHVPEDRLVEGLFLDKPIAVNLVALVLDRVRTALGTVSGAKSKALAQGMASDMKITAADLGAPVQSLSGGNQQRVLIGRALSNNPKILLLHGPTVGVDVGSKDAIYRIIQAQAEQGMSVIIISDDLPELQQNCDRILVMRQGRIEAEFAASEVQEDEIFAVMTASSSPRPRATEPVS
ncbi:MAG: transporter protein [Caulobacteraceae bacterium]|nr:transporter protein [Caulobacteraceae bacterium]